MPKPGFLLPLRVEQISEKDWLLTAPLQYYSALLDRILTVPAGFVTDFASVPRLPFMYWFTGGLAQAPAALHDWIYRTPEVDITRSQGDAVFEEAISARGYWEARSWFMWLGVRLGGWSSYKPRSR